MSWLKKYFYFFPALLYLPAIGNFFSGDDWFHLRITQIDTFQQFINFFSFSQTPQAASFYRPLSTQIFFFVFQKLFGLTAWPYYLFGLVVFAYSIYLVKKFSSGYLKSDICNLAAIIYGISVSNFTRVYFLSAFQELFLVVFSLLALINFRSKPKLSLMFFVLALLSKETAIVLPTLILILNYKYIYTNRFKNLISEILVSVIYLYFRLFHFGLATGDSYLWNFSAVKLVNTLGWYTAWSIGAPELLVDYVGSGLKLVPRFFTDYSFWWSIIVFPLLALFTLVGILFIKNIKALKPSFWQFVAFFVIGLAPVLFLPTHKFALELGLPLVGFSLALAMLLSASSKFNIFSFCFFVIFIFYNLSMNYLTYTRHYSVSRGDISQKVYQYFLEKYQSPPQDKYFVFTNDAADNGAIWGQSKQISQSLSGSDFFKVFYFDQKYTVSYEDSDGQSLVPVGISAINLSTKQFLNK